MQKITAFLILSTLSCFCANAQDTGLDNALRETYMNCVGIDEALHDMKVKAGITTAVTGVGTGLGIGAVATGIAKTKTDREIEEKYNKMTNLAYGASGNTTVLEPEQFMDKLSARLGNHQNVKDQEIERLENKSKRLGNWRTGLLVGNTATNIAGATISGTNKVNKTLEEQIDNCKSSIKLLKNEITRAKFEGKDVSEATQIESACGGFEYIDLSKIDNRAKGSMTSSIVGAGTGVVGTITSALANSNRIRDNNTLQGQKTEKGLNTSANIFAVGSTVASATATAFNAAQIKAIKDIAEIATKCTRVLK